MFIEWESKRQEIIRGIIEKRKKSGFESPLRFLSPISESLLAGVYTGSPLPLLEPKKEQLRSAIDFLLDVSDPISTSNQQEPRLD